MESRTWAFNFLCKQFRELEWLVEVTYLLALLLSEHNIVVVLLLHSHIRLEQVTLDGCKVDELSLYQKRIGMGTGNVLHAYMIIKVFTHVYVSPAKNLAWCNKYKHQTQDIKRVVSQQVEIGLVEKRRYELFYKCTV